MRNLIVLCVAMAFVAITGSSQLMAAEKASTSELPAALQAIGVEQTNILSQNEAENVRGEAFIAAFQIDFISANFAARVDFAGIFNAIAITITPGGIGIGIR